MPHEVKRALKMNVDVLTKSMVDECEKYRCLFSPYYLHIAIGPKTKVSQEVRAYAAKRKIEIGTYRSL